MKYKFSLIGLVSLLTLFVTNVVNASSTPLIVSYCVETCTPQLQLQNAFRVSQGHESDVLLLDPKANTTHHLRVKRQSESEQSMAFHAEYQKSFDDGLSEPLAKRLALYLNSFETMLNQHGGRLNKVKNGYPIYSVHDFLTAEESASFRIQDNYFTLTNSIYTDEFNAQYEQSLEQNEAELTRLLKDEFGERRVVIDPWLQKYVIDKLTVILVEKPGDRYGIKTSLRINGPRLILTDFEELVLLADDDRPELVMSIANWVNKEKYHNTQFSSEAPERYEAFLGKFGFSILKENGRCKPCTLIYEKG